MGDVRPLGGRGERVAQRPDRIAGGPIRVATVFQQPDPGEPLLGYAEGIRKSQLRKLRAGELPPELRIDLHGLHAGEARRVLHDALGRAALAGHRCVVVIHGRGVHSRDEPVLRRELPDWLGDPALAGCVLAFAPATPGDGGRGATYVLLRRRH